MQGQNLHTQYRKLIVSLCVCVHHRYFIDAPNIAGVMEFRKVVQYGEYILHVLLPWNQLFYVCMHIQGQIKTYIKEVKMKLVKVSKYRQVHLCRLQNVKHEFSMGIIPQKMLHAVRLNLVLS